MKKFCLYPSAAVLSGVLALSAPAVAKETALEHFLQKHVQNQLETCLNGIGKVQKIQNRHFVVYTAAGSYDADNRDFPCLGNATWDNLAELKYQNGRYTVVNLDLLDKLGDQRDFAYIENVHIRNGIATLDTLSYGKRDLPHRPRDKHQWKIRLSDMKVLSKKFTGRAPE
ncbi:hypothetical protein [Conchiformibius kuhniae]|uniref:Uncharacterized protein n=1 Tax=Conchiformibius kuhniae TaxID=211502 RepID=A0A8T9MX22_9NEIS|nr:hypothetical protein [Conchiformibius kuhniae]UOP04762.1 hypothetical protein LVJ77_11465 [Conchiformibius kuhniae]